MRMIFPPSWSTSVARKVSSRRFDRGLDHGDELVEMSGGDGDTARRDHLVGAVEVDERDRDHAVLGVASRRPGGASGARPGRRWRDPWSRIWRRRALRGRRSAPVATVAPVPWAAPSREDRSDAAVPGPTTISPASAADSAATVALVAGPATMSSRCEFPTRNRWKTPDSTPIDMRKLRRKPGNLYATRCAQRSADRDRRGTGRRLVTGAAEEQEHGIAAELEQLTVPLVGHGEQFGKAAPDGVRQLLLRRCGPVVPGAPRAA